VFTPEERLNYAALCSYEAKPLVLDFWQNDYIASRKRFICCLKSRRVGFSLVTSLKGLIKALDPVRHNYTKQFVSYNESDALEKIKYASMFYDSIPAKMKKKCVTNNKTCLEFEDVGGRTVSRLISLPCRPPRGKGGDICLDEFGIYLPRMSAEVYNAALPVISRGGCIEVGSTPLGKAGKFYEICTDDKNHKYERYVIPWWFCSALTVPLTAAGFAAAKNMPTDIRVKSYATEIMRQIYADEYIDDFRQEYECEFIDSALSFITLDLIHANTPGLMDIDSEGLAEIKNDEEYFAAKRGEGFTAYMDADAAISAYKPEVHGSPLYLGYDVARTHDGMVFYIIGILNGKKRSFLRIETRNKDFDWQHDVFCRLMKSLPVHRACMDASGMDKPIFERVHKEFGDRIEGVTFTAQAKETLAVGVRLGLEQREFILENDRGFHSQIHSIKRTPLAGGVSRYDAERNDRGHADAFWAWALASFAAGGKSKEMNYWEERALAKKEADTVTSDTGRGGPGEKNNQARQKP